MVNHQGLIGFVVFVSAPIVTKVAKIARVKTSNVGDGWYLRQDFENFVPETSEMRATKIKRVGKIPHSIMTMEITKIKGLRRYEGAGITS